MPEPGVAAIAYPHPVDLRPVGVVAGHLVAEYRTRAGVTFEQRLQRQSLHQFRGSDTRRVVKSERDHQDACQNGGVYAAPFVQGREAPPEGRPVYTVVVHQGSCVDEFGRRAYALGRAAFQAQGVSEQQGEPGSDGFPHENKPVIAVIVYGFVHAAQKRIYFPVYAGQGVVKRARDVHIGEKVF